MVAPARLYPSCTPGPEVTAQHAAYSTHFTSLPPTLVYTRGPARRQLTCVSPVVSSQFHARPVPRATVSLCLVLHACVVCTQYARSPRCISFEPRALLGTPYHPLYLCPSRVSPRAMCSLLRPVLLPHPEAPVLPRAMCSAILLVICHACEAMLRVMCSPVFEHVGLSPWLHAIFHTWCSWQLTVH